MKHLLLFSLGPVQSFIAQARKTHDLYAGSMLLSDLVKKAINTAGGEKQLIFPQMGEAMPNRFLAEVPDFISDLTAFGEHVETAVRNEWKKIANDALAGISRKPQGFDEQINNFLEIFWVIEPLESDEKYNETVARLEKSLSAIKNIRPFAQYRWQNGNSGERGRKCSLDGQRNVQFYRPRNEKDRSETGSPLYSTVGSVYVSNQLPEANILQPGEGVSAVSFAKRRFKYGEIDGFPSTAEIALLDALTFLKDPKKTQEGCIRLHEYRHSFIGGFNAQLYYEEGLSEQFIESQGIQTTRNIEKLRELRKNCLEDLAKENGFKFQKYYAVLEFDGDDMGKWLSGEKLTDKSKLKSFQTAFARCLADFAVAAKKRLDDSSGKTIYAGGDDFLGFVNLNHLFPVLEDLRQLFIKIVDTPLTHFKTDKISFSAGICVAHYKEPLSLVLQEAKEAQKTAKKLDKKDAFAIAVIKGSGESHTTALPFGDNSENVEKLQGLTHSIIRKDFSTNFIKTMRLEFERVMDFQGDQATFEEVFKVELKRLLQRAARKEWSKERKKQEAENMTDTLMELFGVRNTENFFQMLHIADFFQREMDMPQKQITQPLQPA